MAIYDAIVIGAGQAGPSLAGRLAAAGQRVAVIERNLFGGTCVNTGCIPTKTLVASAYAARMARRAADFGVRIEGSVRVDMKAVKKRKDEISAKSRTGVEEGLKGLENCTVHEGHARFRSAREVEVNGEVHEAGRIFINVGGRARVPDIPGLSEVPFLTNSSMMAVDYLPRHLVIVGGSYIGLEFGQMYRRFGSEVTIIEHGPRLVEREDPEVSALIQQLMEQEGIRVLCGSGVSAAARRGDDAVLRLASGNEVAGSHLLLAIGRVPNTHDLGLDKAGVAVDRHGYIVVDEELRTSVPHIWALGDCNGRGAFTHTSYNEYEIVAANLLDHDPRRVSDRIMAYALYIDPPLGRCGMNRTQARASGKRVLVGHRPMTRVARAVEKGEANGFMEILVDADSKLILGGTVFGPGGDEAIHVILDLMYAKAPYTVMQRAMHIHPTVSELLPTILGELKPLA
jgi:pyruvate/2-oxoglutarate dehydrogenase complex dihydrolipoamide dehydrogenase (E3) component